MRTLAVLASGHGTNFEALARAHASGELGGRIACLASDRADAPALDRARHHGIEALVLPTGSVRTYLADERPWLEALRARQVDTVLLAGFLRRLHAPFLDAFPDRILNIHPSLLPSFPGPQAYRQAYEQGVKIIGVSAHFVTMNLDEGPIIAQECFAVRPQMTLRQIIAEGQRLEAKTLLRAVKLYLEKRLDVYWGTVREI